MKRSLWGRIHDLLFGPGPGEPQPPAGAAPPSPAPSAGRLSRSSRSLSYLDPAVSRPKVSMKWRRPSTGPKLQSVEAHRTAKRQRVLVALASVSVLAMGIAAFIWIARDRRLPAAVSGLWRTDAPAYAGRMFELQPRLVAFLSGDSAHPLTTYVIDRVQRLEEPAGTGYRVTIHDEGQPIQFTFVHDPGPPETIHLANQPRLIWHRDPGNRSLLDLR